MRIRLLGDIELDSDGPGLGGPTQRRLLAVLAAADGRTVPLGRLVEVTYGGDDPDGSHSNVRKYVHRLRSSLGSDADALETRANGYRLTLDPDQLDLVEFEEHLTAARRPGGRSDDRPGPR